MHRQHYHRRGLTLTELLVVVSLVVLLAAILLPLVQPVLRGQRVREATRQLNVYLTGAQARAVELGRPAGIWIERAGHEPNEPLPARWYTAYRVYPAEQPEPYRGDVYDARVFIQNGGTIDTWNAFYLNPYLPPQGQIECCSDVWPSLASGTPIVNPGDLIRFNSSGAYYLITQVTQVGFTFRAPPLQIVGQPPLPNPDVFKLVGVDPSNIAASDVAAYQPGVSFEIMRRPVKGTGAPLEFPRNTAIDLSVSGYAPPFRAPLAGLGLYTPARVVGPHPAAVPTRFREINPEYDIVIMFSPDGGIDKVHYIPHEEANYINLAQFQPDDLLPFWEQPHGTLNLFVSRDDNIGRNSLGQPNVINNFTQNAVSSLGEASLNSPDNMWLIVSTQTGTVASAPNAAAFTDPQTGAPLVSLPLSPNTDLIGYGVPNAFGGTLFNNARRFTQSGRSLGGR